MNTTTTQKLNRGFTLIELITAIGVLALLAAVVITAIDPFTQVKKSRDTKRKSDLAQLQRALESFYQDNGRYPPMSPSGNNICVDLGCSNIADWDGNWDSYMDVVPHDPTSGWHYSYWSDTEGQQYLLYASLERTEDPQACTTNGTACVNALSNNITCGTNNQICTYGVSSPNVSP